MIDSWEIKGLSVKGEKVKQIVWAAIAILAMFSQSALAINKAEAKELVDSVQTAVQNKKIDKILSFLSEDAVILISNEYGKTKKKLSFEEYKQYLRHSLSLINHYHYKIENLKTKSDNTLHFTLKEMFFIHTKYYKEIHDQAWTVQKTPSGYEIIKIVVID